MSKWSNLTNEDLIQIIKNKNKELGHSPNTRNVGVKNNLPSVTVFQKRLKCKTWKEVLNYCGLETYNSTKISITKGLKILENFYNEHGYILDTKLFDELLEVPSCWWYQHKFGSLEKAYEQIGITRKDEMLKQLRNKCQELGRTLRTTEAGRKNDIPSCATYMKICNANSWDDVLIMAGVDTVYYDKEKVTNQIKALYKKLGRVPTEKDINKEGNLPSGKWFSHNYGGLKQFYDKINIKRNLSKNERIKISIKNLISISRKLNRIPTCKEYDEIRGEGYSYSTLQRNLKMKYSEICNKYLPYNILNPQPSNIKVCYRCKKEKPLEDFHKQGKDKNGNVKYKGTCKVCSWFNSHKNLNILEGWSKKEYEIVLDCLLNNKINFINEIVNKLEDKNLQNVVDMIRSLNVRGVKLRVKCNCVICGKQFQKQLSNFEVDKNNTCSLKCSKKWYQDIYSQTPERREQLRIQSAKALAKNPTTNTSIQRIVNNLLYNLKINYINEYVYKYYAVDNYLSDYNLIIECMGTFWHCDNRVYDTISYDIQKNSIKKDKAKHTYIKKYEDIEILYLWEEDIMKNLELCKQMILKYIDHKGKLNNYHSFNYYLDKNNKIRLKNKEDIITPYGKYSASELNEVTKILVKQPKKYWIEFKCDNCGSVTKQLKSQYNKNKNHFCCNNCKHEFRNKTVSTKIHCKCEFCKKDIWLYPSAYNKNKHHYCNKECYLKSKTTN